MKSKIIIATLAATVTIIAAPSFAENNGGGKSRPSFSELDANKDGNLTLAELQAAGATRFAAVDTNKDGSLSQDEILAHAQKSESRRAERRAKRMIRRMDENGNGTIELSEMQAKGRGAKMIEHLDKDGDGAVSAEEFEAHKGRRHGGKRGGDDQAKSE